MILSVNDIVREVVSKVSERHVKPVNFIFGDWTYMCTQLEQMSSIQEVAQKKYPLIGLISPYTENKNNARWHSEVSLDFIIASNTISELTNEQREEVSFKAILRPLYALFIDELKKSQHLDFERGHVPHSYVENYGFGARGVQMSENKKFSDLVDIIELKSVELRIKKQIECKYGRR